MVSITYRAITIIWKIFFGIGMGMGEWDGGWVVVVVVGGVTPRSGSRLAHAMAFYLTAQSHYQSQY